MNDFCEKCELNESIKEEKNLLNNAIVEKIIIYWMRTL